MPPFDNLKVRQAVNYAINREALVRIYGGLATADGERASADVSAVQEAQPVPVQPGEGEAADQGRRGRRALTVTVWNHDRGNDPKATAYLADVLNSIGFKAKEKIINSAVYWTTVGNQATKAQIGFADWFQDYPHPLDWFDVLLNGDRITRDAQQQLLELRRHGGQREDRRAEEGADADRLRQRGSGPTVDKMVDASRPPWAPFMNRQFTDFFNADIDLELLREPRALPVRLRDDLPQVAAEALIRVGGAGNGAPDALSRGGGDSGTAGDRERVHARHRGGAGRGRARRGADPRPQPVVSRLAPAAPELRRASPSSSSSSSSLVACALAPVYANHVAHTGPNTNHVLDTIKVNGQAGRRSSSNGGYIDKKTGKPCTVSGTDCMLVSAIPIGPTWFSAGGKFVLGADANGRDVAVRLLYGGRNSLHRRHRLVGDLRLLRRRSSRCSPATSAAGSTS